jgi:hypothetical protein
MIRKCILNERLQEINSECTRRGGQMDSEEDREREGGSEEALHLCGSKEGMECRISKGVCQVHTHAGVYTASTVLLSFWVRLHRNVRARGSYGNITVHEHVPTSHR